MPGDARSRAGQSTWRAVCLYPSIRETWFYRRSYGGRLTLHLDGFVSSLARTPHTSVCIWSCSVPAVHRRRQCILKQVTISHNTKKKVSGRLGGKKEDVRNVSTQPTGHCSTASCFVLFFSWQFELNPSEFIPEVMLI